MRFLRFLFVAYQSAPFQPLLSLSFHAAETEKHRLLVCCNYY